MDFFRVTNWDQYQHYKDRDPTWIKLYARLLDDYEFATLPDNSKWHLIGIFLLASKQGNRIPGDPRWVRKKIAARTRVDLEALRCAGFIAEDAGTPLADCAQGASPEKETEQTREETDSSLSAGADVSVGLSTVFCRQGNTPQRREYWGVRGLRGRGVNSRRLCCAPH
jgi:hypothetical protein